MVYKYVCVTNHDIEKFCESVFVKFSTTAVRSRISPKIVLLSCVGYFDRGCFGYFTTKLEKLSFNDSIGRTHS